MNEMPKHYSLIKEHPDHYMVHDGRDGKAFPISKKGLHPATQLKVLRMKKYAEGGEVSDDDSTASEAPTAFEEQFPKAAQGISDWFNPKNVATPAEAPSSDQSLSPDAAVPPPLAIPQPNVPQQQIAQAPAQGPNPQGNQAPAPMQNSDLNAQQNGYPSLNTLNHAIGEEQSGINQQAQGQIAQNKAMVEIQRQQLALQQEHDQKYQETMQIYQNQNQQLADAVANQKIDPDKYWENHSRIGAAIATVISGIGAGLQHSTQNLAMDVIQKGIDHSIDAQKAELGKNENLLSNNLRVQGNLMAAETATRIQMNAMLQGKIALAAAQTGDPMIIGAARQKNGQIAQAALPQQMQLAQYQTQMHMKQQLLQSDTSHMDPASLVPYVVANDRQQKVYDEIGAAQHTAANAPHILKAFDNASKNIHAVDFIPGMENVDQKALHALLGPTFKDVEGTVRQAAMDNMNKNVTPQFGDDKNTIKTKREALVDYLKSKSAAPTAKGEHLDLTKFNSTRFPDQGNPLEGKTATGPNGQRIIMQGGQWRALK